jgi:hypothetical protein
MPSPSKVGPSPLSNQPISDQGHKVSNEIEFSPE